MEKVKIIRLFLSSPGDVEEERKKVYDIVNEVNRLVGEILNCRLEVIDWKTHVPSQIGPRPQEVINKWIKEYDLYVGIMWKRFGAPTDIAKSGTEEEFRAALRSWKECGHPHIFFYFKKQPYLPETIEETDQLRKVILFKQELQSTGLPFDYQSIEEFARLLRGHLIDVLKKWFPLKEKKGEALKEFDKERYRSYIEYLKKDCMYIDIRGLGGCRTHQFQIDRLYIPLKTLYGAAPDEKRGKRERGFSDTMQYKDIPLHEALKHEKLLIKGDPGAGKTTFLKLIAFTLCQKWLGEETSPGTVDFFPPDTLLLPVLIRPGDLIEHIRQWHGENKSHLPIAEDDPKWLIHFLAEKSNDKNWGLSAEDLRARLEQGHCLILIDGLDEAPDQSTRERIFSLADELLKIYPRCRVVVTSRPAALVQQILPAAFSMVEIAPLDDQAIDTFLTLWCNALYTEAPEKSENLKEEIQKAIKPRPDIVRMVRTPIMLTALAVIYWNEQRLPDNRADLYESVITWLLRTRERQKGQYSLDRSSDLLRKLALAMFVHPEGRQRQVEVRWAAEALASEFDEKDKKKGIKQAEGFLQSEMVYSGIIIGRNHQLEFWHLSF